MSRRHRAEKREIDTVGVVPAKAGILMNLTKIPASAGNAVR